MSIFVEENKKKIMENIWIFIFSNLFVYFFTIKHKKYGVGLNFKKIKNIKKIKKIKKMIKIITVQIKKLVFLQS